MRSLLAAIISFLLVSCEQVEKLDAQLYDSTEDKTPVTSVDQLDAIDKMENTVAKDNSEKMIFKAIGSEPGWIAEFYNNRLRLLVDYGKDSLLLFDDKFESVASENGYYYKKDIETEGKKLPLEIKIENTKCTDMSGETLSRKATVKFKGKTYKGCGLVVD